MIKDSIKLLNTLTSTQKMQTQKIPALLMQKYLNHWGLWNYKLVYPIMILLLYKHTHAHTHTHTHTHSFSIN